MHGDCPEGFLCTSVRSLDRTQSNQCLPISGRCVSGCDSKRVQESRSEIDIGIDAELEMNLCSGRIKQVNVDVEPGEGVRVLIDHAESEAERSGVGLSVWSRGTDSWGSWHLTSGSNFELKCASEAISLTVELWRWWGTGLHRLIAERIDGGCSKSCSDDMLEGATTVPVVEESTRFSTLSLCALDSDAFDLMGLEMERWRMQLNVPGQNSQIRARILTLPDFAELSVRLLSSGEVMELPPLDRVSIE